MAARSSSTKVFNDPVHGSIELDSQLMKIIDTPQFQRLRQIKQLGTGCFVYPSAVHTRFEHSIGVCYIAGELLKRLQEQHPKLIDDKDVLCVKIAALCHDLGHGPFSHVYDKLFEDKSSDLVKHLLEQEDSKLAEHEYRSVEILTNLLNSKLKKYFDLNELDITFIKALITFDKVYGANKQKYGQKQLFLQHWNEEKMGRKREKIFLFEIVANGFTGIDVDKMDYFARDSHGLGLPNKFAWRRYIQTARVIECEMDGLKLHRLCTRDKDEHSLCELFHMRYVLHRAACRHKTTIIIEHKIMEALKTANDSVQFKGEGNQYRGIMECAFDMEAFTQLTDSVLDLIMLGPDAPPKETKCPPTELPDAPPKGTKCPPAELPSAKIQLTFNLYKAKQTLMKIKQRELPKFIGRRICRGEESEKQEDILKEFSQRVVGKKIIKQEEAKHLIILHEKFTSQEREKIMNHFFYGKYRDKNNEEQGFALTDAEMTDLLPKSSVQPEMFFYYEFDDVTEEEKIEEMGNKIKKMKEELRKVNLGGEKKRRNSFP